MAIVVNVNGTNAWTASGSGARRAGIAVDDHGEAGAAHVDDDTVIYITILDDDNLEVAGS